MHERLQAEMQMCRSSVICSQHGLVLIVMHMYAAKPVSVRIIGCRFSHMLEKGLWH